MNYLLKLKTVMNISKKNILLYLKLALPLLTLFIVVYGGANWLNSMRDDYFNIYFPWELAIPLIPEMILVYLSMQLLFILPLFHCDSLDMTVLAKRMTVAIILAGAIFMLVPTQLGFVRTDSVESFQWLFTALYSLDKQHNLFPSLHIILSTLVVIALLKQVNGLLKFIYLAWLGALYLSVLLVHQHHIMDIIGGLFLTFLCTRWVAYPEKMVSV